MDLWENYRKRTHVIGRITSTIVLLMLLAAPFLIGKYLGAFPDLKAVAGGLFVSWLSLAGEQRCGNF